MWIRVVPFVCLFAIPAAAQAQLPSSRFSPINYFGRYHGIGYSDGYHECKGGECKREPNKSLFQPSLFQPISSFYGEPTSPSGPAFHPLALGYRSSVPVRYENCPPANPSRLNTVLPGTTPMNATPMNGDSSLIRPAEPFPPTVTPGIQLDQGTAGNVPSVPSTPIPPHSQIPKTAPPKTPTQLPEYPPPSPSDRTPPPSPSLPSLYEQVPPAPKSPKAQDEFFNLPSPKTDNAYLPAQRPAPRGNYSLIQSAMFRK